MNVKFFMVYPPLVTIQLTSAPTDLYDILSIPENKFQFDIGEWLWYTL